MSNQHTVRIGVKSARELELEVDDPSAVSAAYEKALKSKDSVLWITDTREHRFGIAIDSVAFIEIERPTDRGVGFGS
ncbi:MAG: DUF3107 family protein [Actinomycetota bacterium]